MELHEPPSVALTKLLGLIAPQLVNKLQVTKQTNKSIIVFLIIIIAPFYPIGRVGFRVKDSSAKVGTICILHSFSASSIWRESLSFLVAGSVNG